MEPLPSRAEIEEITPFINSVIPQTPQYNWPLLSERTGCEAWVKHENHAPTGSFKVRGGVAYVARLKEREPNVRALVLATRGNHGQSIAFAARRFGIPTTIVVPHGNSAEKNLAMRALGAEVVEHGSDFQEALEHSKTLASRNHLHWVPSFHRDLVCGIAVSTLSFLQNAPTLNRVYVPIGLGSGICAMIAARNALGLKTKVIGVASASAPGIALSFVARTVVTHAVSTRIADGLACSTPNADAFEHIVAGVDRVITVSDDEVEAAMRAYFVDTHNVAEGAAGAGLAALLKDNRAAGERVGVVLTGGNVDRAVFARVLSSGL